MLIQENPSLAIDLEALARFTWRQRMFMEKFNLHISLDERFKYLVTDIFIVVSRQTGHDRLGQKVKIVTMSKTLFYVIITHGECEVNFTMSLDEDSLVWAEEILDAYNDLYAQFKTMYRAG